MSFKRKFKRNQTVPKLQVQLKDIRKKSRLLNFLRAQKKIEEESTSS